MDAREVNMENDHYGCPDCGSPTCDRCDKGAYGHNKCGCSTWH